jgi:hypothetical protein
MIVAPKGHSRQSAGSTPPTAEPGGPGRPPPGRSWPRVTERVCEARPPSLFSAGKTGDSHSHEKNHSSGGLRRWRSIPAATCRRAAPLDGDEALVGFGHGPHGESWWPDWMPLGYVPLSFATRDTGEARSWLTTVVETKGRRSEGQ